MNTFRIYEEDGSFLEEIPQRGLKIWLASSYLTYSDYWMYLDNTIGSDSSTYSEFLAENPDLEYFEYLKVLTALYNDLVNRLNDFTEQDNVEWEGYHLFKTTYRKNIVFTINKRDVSTEKVSGITRV